jgi:hypothetical protein
MPCTSARPRLRMNMVLTMLYRRKLNLEAKFESADHHIHIPELYSRRCQRGFHRVNLHLHSPTMVPSSMMVSPGGYTTWS